MEQIVLPTLDEFDDVSILAWIDDLILAADTASELVDMLVAVLDRLIAIGGRLNIAKCAFLVRKFEWCGVEVDLQSAEWRIAPERVQSLLDTPLPDDRVALHHVLGILRYYFFGVPDQLAQRQRIDKLAELDVPNMRVKEHWTAEHTTAMREAVAAITAGDWSLVYNPRLPVYVTTDAATGCGFSVIANQYDERTGRRRAIAYYSCGWRGPQKSWIAQVMECYAQYIAVTKVMRKMFPYARVILLGDNKNLAAEAESDDPRIIRWRQNMVDSGCERKGWIPGEWNTIADYASRTVVADPNAALNAEEEFEMHLYSIVSAAAAAVEAGSGTTDENGSVDAELSSTVVQGHLVMAPMTAKIVAAQYAASSAERASWEGVHHSTAELGGKVLHLYKNRLIVPSNADEIKQVLLRMAHDDEFHYAGAARTLMHLYTQARVYWKGINEDVARYVASCFRCEFAKANSHSPAKRGSLSPTHAPYVNHTWYVDLKPMPHDTGNLMSVVDMVSRRVWLRYLPNGTAQEVIEETEEVIWSAGTRPVVMRTDGGPPFDSREWKKFCAEEGIETVKGVPYHSQGQGKVETFFRPIAAAIIAQLGHKAPREWWKGRGLAHLEAVVNSTYCEPINGSPFWAYGGVEPRTRMRAMCDWTQADFGSAVCVPGLTHNDYNEIIAAHHDRMNAVQGRVMLASSLAQALTKRAYDASHEKSDFSVDEWVLIHRVAPNRMLPHFTGPYCVTHVSPDRNFVRVRHYLDAENEDTSSLIHVSRLLHFDMSRATTEDIASFQLDSGSYVVADVIEHRKLDDGSIEYHLRWLGTPVTSWMRSDLVKKVVKVLDYAKMHDLPVPGATAKRPVIVTKASARTARLDARAARSSSGDVHADGPADATTSDASTAPVVQGSRRNGRTSKRGGANGR